MTMFDSVFHPEGSINGEPVFSERLVAPKWYWAWCFIGFFVPMVFARWEPELPMLGLRTAWEVAWIIYGDELKDSPWLWLPKTR